jgi:Golgi nucleoside diphosphatase
MKSATPAPLHEDNTSASNAPSQEQANMRAPSAPVEVGIHSRTNNRGTHTASFGLQVNHLQTKDNTSPTFYVFSLFFIKSATPARATPAPLQEDNTSASNAPSQEQANMSAASAAKGVFVPDGGKVRKCIRCILMYKKEYLSIHISS